MFVLGGFFCIFSLLQNIPIFSSSSSFKCQTVFVSNQHQMLVLITDWQTLHFRPYYHTLSHHLPKSVARPQSTKLYLCELGTKKKEIFVKYFLNRNPTWQVLSVSVPVLVFALILDSSLNETLCYMTSLSFVVWIEFMVLTSTQMKIIITYWSVKNCMGGKLIYD